MSNSPSLLLLCMGFISLLTFASAGLNERHLINHLLNSYNPLERPVVNENDTLNVIFGITLNQIIDVDEKNQILITNLWLKFQWVDINLRWNPDDYGGVENLRISTDRIWIPDVLMYNSADERFDSTFRTNVVVNHTGGCLYVPPGVFKSTCRIDITWFPFDDQLCELKFGSWSYDGLLVNLLQENISADTSPYLPNGEWVLVQVPSIRTSQFYECCPGPFVDIKFIIHLKRRTLYYGFNLIIPCIILSSMTLLSFSLPPESGEKLHLGVTILLSMTVFLVQLSKILPATSDSISIIALYFGSIMIMVAVSVVMTVVVLNFHHRSSETKEMGPRLRKFLLEWLPRLLHLSRPGIKPPKQCIKKVSSKQKLVAALSCGKRLDFSTSIDHLAPEEDMLIMPVPGLCKHSSNDTIQIDKLNNAACSVSLRRAPILVNDDPGNLTPILASDTIQTKCCMSHHLYRGVTDDMLFRHENDCMLRQVDKRAANSDSFDMTKTEEISCQPDDTKLEDEPLDVEDCLDEDLDLEVSISLNERARIKKDLKDQQPESRNLEKKPKCQHAELDSQHLAKHQYLCLKRRQKLLEILVEMRFITDRLRQEDQIKELISEWRYGATVLDRLCLILFTLFTLLSLAICLISAPQLIV